MSRRGPSSPPGHIPFTPRAKKVLEYSLREARQLGEQVIEKAVEGGRTTLFEAEEVDRPGVQKPDIHPAPTPHKAVLHCSFCLEPQDRVAKLIAGPGVYICDRCVGLCQEILDEEIPPSGAPG